MKQKPFAGRNTTGYLMLIPATVFILLLNIYPLVHGVVMTFQDVTIFNINKPRTFIGLRNYTELLSDKAFRETICFTVIYTLSVVVFSYLIGLGLALLSHCKFRLRGIFRAFILVPWVLPTIVAAAAWQWMLGTKGAINSLLLSAGIIDSSIPFWADIAMAQCSVTAMAIWKGFPFMALTLLAALQTVPEELYEAAKVDGAGKWQIFLYITLPAIKEISFIAILMRAIWTFNNYEQVFLLTAGGPAKSTMTFSIYSYLSAFSSNRLSYAATISVLMMFLLLAGIIGSYAAKKRKVVR